MGMNAKYHPFSPLIFSKTRVVMSTNNKMIFMSCMKHPTFLVFLIANLESQSSLDYKISSISDINYLIIKYQKLFLRVFYRDHLKALFLKNYQYQLVFRYNRHYFQNELMDTVDGMLVNDFLKQFLKHEYLVHLHQRTLQE